MPATTLRVADADHAAVTVVVEDVMSVTLDFMERDAVKVDVLVGTDADVVAVK